MSHKKGPIHEQTTVLITDGADLLRGKKNKKRADSTNFLTRSKQPQVLTYHCGVKHSRFTRETLMKTKSEHSYPSSVTSLQRGSANQLEPRHTQKNTDEEISSGIGTESTNRTDRSPHIVSQPQATTAKQDLQTFQLKPENFPTRSNLCEAATHHRISGRSTQTPHFRITEGITIHKHILRQGREHGLGGHSTWGRGGSGWPPSMPARRRGPG